MKKSKNIFLITLFLSLLYPLSSFANLLVGFKKNDIFSIITINSIGIDVMLIKYALLFWQIIAIIILVLKLLIFTILPIISFIKKSKPLFVIQFVLIFIDLFLIFTLPNNYFILISNISYHILSLILHWNCIKFLDDN